jgi:hypothetical protein
MISKWYDKNIKLIDHRTLLFRNIVENTEFYESLHKFISSQSLGHTSRFTVAKQ